MTRSEILDFLYRRRDTKGHDSLNDVFSLADLCIDLLNEVEFRSMQNDFRVVGGEPNPLAGTTFGRLGPPNSSRTEEQ